MARNTRVAAAVALSSGAGVASGPVGDWSWVHAMADNRTERARAEWYDRMEKPRLAAGDERQMLIGTKAIFRCLVKRNQEWRSGLLRFASQRGKADTQAPQP